MATRIKASTKGQIVLPKRTRDRLGIIAGTELEVIDTAGGVELRPARKQTALSVDEAIKRAQAVINYTGPRLGEADWQRGIHEAIATKWAAKIP